MNPNQAKTVIEEIDKTIDEIIAANLDNEHNLLEPLYRAQELIFDSFSGDEYKELNNLFEREAVRLIDDEEVEYYDEL